MARRNIDEIFEEALTLVENMVDDGETPEMRGFRNFSLDMTRSMVDSPEEGITFAAKCRVAGQKVAERNLWSFVAVAPSKVAAAEAAERQRQLDVLARQYESDPSFELDCDVMTLAIGLAEAYRHHTGEDPLFLLDDNGDL